MIFMRTKMIGPDARVYPFVVSCDEKDCYYIVSAKTLEQAAESHDSHKCPHRGATHDGTGLHLQSRIWPELDRCVDYIMMSKSGQETDPAKLEYFKGKASGLALVISFLAVPYMSTPDEVSAESLRRYNMRIGKIPFEHTAGDGYDPLRDGASARWADTVAEMKRKGAASKTTITPPPNLAPRPRTTRKAQRIISSDVVVGIKNGLAAGFDSAMLADLYSVTVAEVDGFRE